jgi:hypothetical protein
MTSVDIPERLEWRCMLPVQVLRVLDSATVSAVIAYNSTGLDVLKEVQQDGLSFPSPDAVRQWFDNTDNHFVEFVGGLHGRGRFFGYDRKTGDIRSLWHDIMKHLGYATEEDE